MRGWQTRSSGRLACWQRSVVMASFGRGLDEAGLDAELARGWTLLRAVDYQLWGLSLGLTEDPALCATVLRWLSLTGRP